MSQQQLAERIGVAFQQAHKYEMGINRLSAGRLYSIAGALGVEVSYFYEGLLNKTGPLQTHDQRLLLDLMRNFLSIPDRNHQQAVVSLVRGLAATGTRKD
jgi:transcriptional regulator with XRE-family HTH domain